MEKRTYKSWQVWKNKIGDQFHIQEPKVMDGMDGWTTRLGWLSVKQLDQMSWLSGPPPIDEEENPQLMAKIPPLNIAKVTILVEYTDGATCTITTTGMAESIAVDGEYDHPKSNYSVKRIRNVVFRINKPQLDPDGYAYNAVFERPTI